VTSGAVSPGAVTARADTPGAVTNGVAVTSSIVSDFDHLRFGGVCYDYGRRRVLSRVSFTCTAGAITGLLGPNGAGKSTLLGIAATRARASQGEVHYGAQRASASDWQLRAQIGWLGHDPGFYPELTARENLAFYARLHGAPREAIAGRVERALEHAGLAARADDLVGGFSRGMRQRLGLERALLHHPRLVLLDEPFTGLDDSSAAALLTRLRTLRDEGAIVLLSTHDLDLVSQLLDRVIILRAGRIVDDFESVGKAEDRLRERYRQALVQEIDAAPPPPTQVTPPPASTPVPHEETFGRLVGRFVGAAWLIMRKDLVVEFRSRELFLTTLFFAVSCVLVFAFALVRDGRPMEDAAAGILWIAVAFSGTLALGRTFEREQAHQTLPALLQAPVERAAVYVGKLLGLLVLLLIVELVVVPLVALFFQASLLALGGLVGVIVLAGTVGFLAVGTLFSAMLVRTRSRDVLLPVLLYPMTIPVMLAGVRGTSALIQATPDFDSLRMWLAMLGLFDAVFLTLALWTFEAVTSD
jgi:heme exporter protein CcmB